MHSHKSDKKILIIWKGLNIVIAVVFRLKLTHINRKTCRKFNLDLLKYMVL